MVANGIFALNDVAANDVDRRTFERSVFVDQLESQHANAPNVDRRPVFFLLDDFWSHVLVSACDDVTLEVTGGTAPAEIAELDGFVLVYQYVFEFDVSVNDVFLVKISQCQKQLIHDLCGLGLGDAIHLLEVSVVVALGRELEQQTDFVAVDSEVVETGLVAPTR